MTILQTLHKQIERETKRIEMMKTLFTFTYCIDTMDFATSETRNAKALIIKLQLEFDNEYELQNN